MRLSSALVRHYRAASPPAAQSERVLAVGRAFLTVCSLVAIYFDPTEPARLREITYGLLGGYAVYSVAILVLIHGAPRLTPSHGRSLHALDILWASVLTFVSDGPVSPLFLFFLFTVVAGAYRWGFRETIATAVLTESIFLLETAVASLGPWHERWFSEIDFDISRTILRVSYLLLTGFLLGYLAERQKESQAEIAAIADVAQQPRVELGLGGSMSAIARSMRTIFEAASVAVVIHDHERQRTLLWQLDRTESEGGNEPPTRRVELDADGKQSWLFADGGRAWHATRRGDRGTAVRVTESGVWPVKRLENGLPPEFVSLRSFHTP